MRSTLSLAVLSALSSVSAVYQGFNYGAFFTDRSPKMQSDFEAEFRAAQNLVGAPGNGFTSARLYTMVVSSSPTPFTLPLFNSRSYLLAMGQPRRGNQRHPGRHRHQHHAPPRHVVLSRPGRLQQRAHRP
jgi:glucan endo-1,3-beta-D-glucosidase